MIYSMTAFARREIQGKWGVLICEMRSINHRYLEMSLHLPESLRLFEMAMRERIRQHLKRGKIECNMRLEMHMDEDNIKLNLNLALAKELIHASEKIGKLMSAQAPTAALDVLRMPGVLQSREMDNRFLEAPLLDLLEQTLQELLKVRQREGEELKVLFLQRLDLMAVEVAKVRKHLPTVLNEQTERLKKRFADAKIDLDPLRLEQEMVIFAQRIDVAEELDRTETHMAEVRRVLNQDGAAGRRLDFLLQELNREANTLGSKSVDPIITRAAVEMKVLIEQIREQVQNVE